MSTRLRSLTALGLAVVFAFGGQPLVASADPGDLPPVARPSVKDPGMSPEDVHDWLCRWLPMACRK